MPDLSNVAPDALRSGVVEGSVLSLLLAEVAADAPAAGSSFAAFASAL